MLGVSNDASWIGLAPPPDDGTRHVRWTLTEFTIDNIGQHAITGRPSQLIRRSTTQLGWKGDPNDPNNPNGYLWTFTGTALTDYYTISGYLIPTGPLYYLSISENLSWASVVDNDSNTGRGWWQIIPC
jgi:hypothetical protein